MVSLAVLEIVGLGAIGRLFALLARWTRRSYEGRRL
jgi:hypothetical protein